MKWQKSVLAGVGGAATLTAGWDLLPAGRR